VVAKSSTSILTGTHKGGMKMENGFIGKSSFASRPTNHSPHFPSTRRLPHFDSFLPCLHISLFSIFNQLFPILAKE
jgi:hypothetical protein